MANLSLSEQISYSTVRIECEYAKGGGTGTGFFFKFLENGDQYVPVVITNKHVVAGANRGRLILSKANNNGELQVGREFPPDPSKLTARLRAGLAVRPQELIMAREGK